MKALNLNDIRNSNINDLSIINDNNKNNRFNLRYKNNEILIDTETLFEKCNIFRQNNIPKIKMNINKHDELIKTFNILYNNISYYIETNDNIFLFEIINPIYKKYNIETLFANINSKTIIKNIENDKIIKFNELENRIFNMYPILTISHMNLHNDRLYIIFSFHTIFVKILEDFNLDIDYHKIKKLMN